MIYKIKKGWHYSSLLPRLVCSNSIKGEVTFLGDFIYEIERQGDTNKLIGLSDCLDHHNDSIRLGWRYHNGTQQIMVIVYINRKRLILYLCDFVNYIKYNFEIKILDNCYFIKFGANTMTLDRKSTWSYPRFLLKPYFGGKAKAPKGFKFKIDLK